MIQLQSFNSLFLLIGVVAALLLADKPMGFVALLGVLALTGTASASLFSPDRGQHLWQSARRRQGERGW
jgi:hypothetical protein